MDDKRQAQINAGQQAARALADPAMTKAFADLDDELVKRWRTSRDRDERDRIWLSISMLGKLKDTLAATAANGRVTQRQLDEMLEKRPRAA